MHLYKTILKPVTALLFIILFAWACKDDNDADPDPEPVTDGILFQENFDDQPDYTSSETLKLKGWTHCRNGEDIWSPSTGFPDHHDAFEILSSNADKARGGSGKSFVGWRESYKMEWNNWNSDGILAKYFEEGHEKLYVRFWIRFSDNFTPAGQTKLFRISSWDEEGDFFGYGPDRYNAPIMIWDYNHNDYGQRNFLAFRGHPQETNYFQTNPKLVDLPRNIHNGDINLNFDNNIRDLDGDGNNENEVTLKSLVTGEILSGIVSHDDVYGNEWHKVEFFIQMNSAPGAMDGIIVQWLDDQLIFKNTKMPWMGNESEGGRKFNVVAIGGNDFFRSYPNEDKHEEWYAIDDIEMRSSLPEGKSLNN